MIDQYLPSGLSFIIDVLPKNSNVVTVLYTGATFPKNSRSFPSLQQLPMSNVSHMILSVIRPVQLLKTYRPCVKIHFLTIKFMSL